MKTNWVDSFKLALIKEDDKTIGKLLEDIPDFEDVEDMKVASNLIEEAISTFTKKRQETLAQMDYIKKSRKFLEDKELQQRERINLSL
ncbi:MAG: hypothetical protein ACLFOC_06830 [Campylobacterales bacterium]